MVEGFVGLPASGKTYFAVNKAMEAMKLGIPVYANFSIKGAKKFRKLNEVFNIRKGVIIVDEINLVCPSRFWNKFPPELAYFWSQTRKMELDIYWTAQHEDRVDKIIREISNYVWIIKKLPFGFRYAREFLPEQLRKEKAILIDSKIFRIKKKIYENYNTYEMIDIADNLR